MQSLLSLVRRNLWFHRRMNSAVAFAVAASTAVLTGALLVGDSVRDSLRQLTLERLGRVEQLVVCERFFDDELADRLEQAPQFQKFFDGVQAVVLLRGTAESMTPSDAESEPRIHRVQHVSIMGCDERFWTLGKGAPGKVPGPGQVVLNRSLARELEVDVGESIVLRLPATNEIPADSAVGRKADTIRSLAGLEVVAIATDEGLGQFSLQASQRPSRNAFVDRSTLSRVLKQPDKANALLIAGRKMEEAAGPDADAALRDSLQPTLSDYGISLQRIQRTFGDSGSKIETIFDYFSLSTDRMLFTNELEQTIETALKSHSPQPVLTYLATAIGKRSEPPANLKPDGTAPVQEFLESDIPYSIITAMDDRTSPSPLLGAKNIQLTELDDEEILLNQWAADVLRAKPGDWIFVNFMEPESSHGLVRKQSAWFRLKAVIPLTEPSQPFRRNREAQFDSRPTPANDPNLTPVVDGLTDRESLEDWDAPFPYEANRIAPRDEQYWDHHRTTPKAFVSLNAGRRLWSSPRFGRTTSFRIPTGPQVDMGLLSSQLVTAFDNSKTRPGFQFLPVKRRALVAARGTTSFSGLFLGFSFFLIAAALMLVALLFRLGIQQRGREIGLLAAVGLRRQSVARLLSLESGFVALAGGLLGTLIGILYAWLMLSGLTTWWQDAVSTTRLELFVGVGSLAVGLLSGVITSWLAARLMLRGLQNLTVREMMAGSSTTTPLAIPKTQRRVVTLAVLMMILAIVLALLATQLVGEAQAGAFFAAGACVLTGILTFVQIHLTSRSKAASIFSSYGGLLTLALRNAARNPGRSTLTIGLVATSCFLIVAISAFRQAPSALGTGGFDLIAESAQPLFHDPHSPEGQSAWNLGEEHLKMLLPIKLLKLRVKAGDDASCLNLYQGERPQVLGVSPKMIAHFSDNDVQSFGWAESAAVTEEEQANPWLLLDQDQEDGTIPVILDKNTAMYSLHLYKLKGTGTTFTIDDEGRPLHFKIVGLLSNSILQGSLLISESQFTRTFPDIGGYRFFLIDSQGQSQQVMSVLENRLSDQGMDVEIAETRLAELLAVQNTYLSTFQSLGTLGLLLGTFGLAAVQLRNVLERRGELALMRATGFRRSRLGQLVYLESGFLLLAGLTCGILAAAVVVLPHGLTGGASIPVGSLAGMLCTVALVGLAAGLFAVRATLKAPMISALRGD